MLYILNFPRFFVHGYFSQIKLQFRFLGMIPTFQSAIPGFQGAISGFRDAISVFQKVQEI